ncbi:MAG: aspartate aminotransferase family protein [Aequoribacter sp.]|uniref:aspartate aminotransferase family protein n=1 Tax=Aequoribacter sp. TaxID=2847771 RepID=UPI003C670429
MSSIMPTYKRLPVQFVRGQGAWLYDTSDTAYLDALTGIAVTGLGHCHPAVSAALAKQAQTLMHCSNLYHIPTQEVLAETLCRIAGMDAVFFGNSGAEANEAAIKLARLYGHQNGIESPTIIVLEHAFHGRTMATLTATGNAAVQKGFEPLVPGFIRVPAGDIEAIAALANNANIVAVLAEPVQGEGGVRRLSDDYLRGLREQCDRNNWLLMFDEVQSGNGRVGTYFAYLGLNFKPDVVTTAKGLGNGVPIGACLAQGKAARVLGAGNHGSTYGGNPLASAAAMAVINTIEQDNLTQRVPIIRKLISESLYQQSQAATDLIKTESGQGLMLGFVMSQDCPELVSLALEQKLLINVTAGNVVRLLPALTLTDDEAILIGERLAGVIDTYAWQIKG